MVDAERLALVRFLLADRADPALALEHRNILFERDSVVGPEAVLAPRHGVFSAALFPFLSEELVAMFRVGLSSAAPALADFFLVGLIVGLPSGEQLLPIRRIGLPSATEPLVDLFFVRLLVGARIRDLFLSKLLIFGVSLAQSFEMRTHVSRTRKKEPTKAPADEAAGNSGPPRRSQRAPRGPDMLVVRLAQE
jgi:hypothetical protein